MVHGLSLEHVHELVGVLGDPQRAYPVIHLTGTNGKGSTARMITALLVEHGLSVGTYTSPHLQRINERIAWNGQPISDEELAATVTELARPGAAHRRSSRRTSSCSPPPRFQWFADNAVDVAVVEVGLLGRYDATNVVDADVAVVTNVGQRPHRRHGRLAPGDRLGEGGIVKPDSFLVLGETDPELQAVFLAEGPRDAWRREVDFDVRRRPRRGRRAPARPAHARWASSTRSSCRCTGTTRPTTRRARWRRSRPSSTVRSTTTWCRPPSPG